MMAPVGGFSAQTSSFWVGVTAVVNGLGPEAGWRRPASKEISLFHVRRLGEMSSRDPEAAAVSGR